MFLQSEFDRIESAIPHMEKRNKKVSNSSVAWQIDHLLKVLAGVLGSLRKSDPADYKSDFNFKRLYICSIGIIPRGKVRAPKSVQPPSEITKEDLVNQISKVKYLTSQVEELPSKSYFKHAFLGMLNKRKAKRFLTIHTRHHLKIIDDILKK